MYRNTPTEVLKGYQVAKMAYSRTSAHREMSFHATYNFRRAYLVLPFLLCEALRLKLNMGFRGEI